MRRGTFTDDTVDYAAVGATQAADLMGYPPERSKPAEQSVRLGSGEERFRSASETLLSWGAFTGAGLRVGDVRPAAGGGYSGVAFDAEGNPVAPAKTSSDQRFTSEGLPFVAAGTTVHVRGRIEGQRAEAELRVILCSEEPRRVAVALGTVSGSVVSGEEGFFLEWREDDEVWFSVRAFDRPVWIVYRLFPYLVKRRRQALIGAYLRALSPMYATP